MATLGREGIMGARGVGVVGGRFQNRTRRSRLHRPWLLSAGKLEHAGCQPLLPYLALSYNCREGAH